MATTVTAVRACLVTCGLLGVCNVACESILCVSAGLDSPNKAWSVARQRALSDAELRAGGWRFVQSVQQEAVEGGAARADGVECGLQQERARRSASGKASNRV